MSDASPADASSASAAAPHPAIEVQEQEQEQGMILPPPAIRSIVDKTAAFVAKSPNAALFEDKIRAREKSDSRFAFLNDSDAYHPYYQHRLEAYRAGEAPAAGKTDANGVDAGQNGDLVDETDGRPAEPPALEFLVESPPAINAVDLDILRLTALFTARSGRRFTSELASRENRNYQFDFLRPSHSLFGYFNRLTEQYTKVLIPSKDAQGRLERRSGSPASDSIARLSNGRREVLADARQRVEWERWESSRRKQLEDAQEADRIAFAEIDWQDFVVVSTVEFTEGDEAGLVELPPPMSISEVENMTIAQKKMAAMIMEGREEEVAEDERERARGEEAEMEMDDDDDDGIDAEARERERQRVVEVRAADSNAPMKIRKDYVPKSKRPAQAAEEYTTFGDQKVPVKDFAEHVRIELLDPRWKEEKRQSDANRSASNLLPGGTDVSSSIRALAAHRPDIFGTGGDEEARRQAEALAKSKAREMGVWDGHTATRDAIQSRYQNTANFDEQIEALHRSKGLLGADDGTPQIGPSAPAPAPVASAPEPSVVSGASFSAAPQPNQTTPAYPQQSYSQGGYGQQQAAYAPAPTPAYPPPPASQAAPPHPIASLPARPVVPNPGEAASSPLPGGSGSPAPVNFGRAAEVAPEDEPSAKRQRVQKRTDGSLWPESEWNLAHPDPVTIKIKLPDYPSKPAWGCDGSELTFEVPLTLLVGAVRDRITAKAGLPISKQKFVFNGRPIANQVTLASLNFEDGDTIEVSVKEKR